MNDKPKRRWYQFSLRTMFAIITLSATVGAWWNHRDFCLREYQFHSGRHLAFADYFTPQNVHSDWRGNAEFVFFPNDGRPVVCMQNRSFAPSGFKRMTLTVEEGVLPDTEQEIKSKMDREAELADQYFHAIWRPWERLWVKVEPHQPTPEEVFISLSRAERKRRTDDIR